MPDDFLMGFVSLKTEYTLEQAGESPLPPDQRAKRPSLSPWDDDKHQVKANDLYLKVKGEIPSWLNGTFVRNGPALFDLNNYKMRHFFDGMAMLHSFTIQNGQVSYLNRYLQSRAFNYATTKGELGYREAASEPHTTMVDRVMMILSPKYTDNASDNVIRVKDKFIAITETVGARLFDPLTLRTGAEYKLSEGIEGELTSPHPHIDYKRNLLYNFTTDFSLDSATYNIYSLNLSTMERRLVNKLRVKQAAYMHSFSMTPNYIILTEYPFRLPDPMSVLFKDKPVYQDFVWTDAKEGGYTRFLVIDKNSGRLVKVAKSEAFFAVHHVNAFEEGKEIVIDICTYDNAKLLNKYFFNNLLKDYGGEFPAVTLKRFRVPLSDNSSIVSCTLLTKAEDNIQVDFPRFNYRCYNGHPYRYIFGIGIRPNKTNDFANQILKVDLHTGTAKVWYQEHCYPSETVFVPEPAPKGANRNGNGTDTDLAREDRGILLSVILDGKLNKSYLLILSAYETEINNTGRGEHRVEMLKELARVEVPHVIPFGIHGDFFEGVVRSSNIQNYLQHQQKSRDVIKIKGA